MKKQFLLICMAMLTIAANAQNNYTKTNTPADFQPKFGFKAGYNWHLAKPVATEQLIEIVGDAVNRRPRSSP